MTDSPNPRSAMQDHDAYREGTHDFQTDIDILARSDLIKTVLETIAQATGARFTAVARVTDRRWVACRTVDDINFGLAEGDEIEIQSTFCQSVRDTGDHVIFDDVETDEVYCGHPIAKQFGIVSYASIPIFRRDGSFFGTLCAIDTEPRDLSNPRTIAMLEMFSNIVSKSLENEERLVSRELLIEKERAMAELQQEFIAILGHDLRSPVSAIDAGLRQLVKEELPENAQYITRLMRPPLLRVNELIDNMMMHAKLRLGKGFHIEPMDDAPIVEQLKHILAEQRLAAPDHQIQEAFAVERAVSCDTARVGQAVSNLLSNAIAHGRPNAPIRLEAETKDGLIYISISNHGDPIPQEIQRSLFAPYSRGETTRSDGLGLGLYIARSIAQAHGGDIELSRDNEMTTFCLFFPIDNALTQGHSNEIRLASADRV
ncbi:GAF domain-containing sensor histidine kinase [Maritalea mediterranea]|uniref:histidine kinase n=1 Tax=Maritalea mediterranea TaxID=2909667 RepID=A0ABS9EAF9_9HYPH|nr:GAF domain-containing sensor histidine kinase [Maritalea mediterranea]MCF4099748.1 GAF domain-containing sensor histidine kinase [Maritalea mediterranea]